MKKIILAAFLIIGCGNSPETSVQASQRSITKILTCPQNVDIAPYIQAADIAMGAKTGTIIIPSGNYIIGGNTLIGRNHTLHLSAGTYTATAPSRAISTFSMNDNSVIEGDGNNTILLEPPSLTLVLDHGAEIYGGGPGMDGWALQNLRVKSNNNILDGSWASLVVFANGTNSRIENVWFDHIQSSPIEAGYGSQSGQHGDNITIRNNRFTGINTSCVAIVNATNVKVEKNNFESCVMAIDIEPNELTDATGGFIIRNNIGLSGFIQSAITGPGEVSNNTVSGLAIYNAHDVVVRGNKFNNNYIYGAALFLGGATNTLVEGNTITNSGTIFADGGAPAIQIMPDVFPNGQWHGATNNIIRNNRIIATTVGSGLIAEKMYDGIPEAALVPPDYNTYEKNTIGPGRNALGQTEKGAIITLGTHDIIKKNILH